MCVLTNMPFFFSSPRLVSSMNTPAKHHYLQKPMSRSKLAICALSGCLSAYWSPLHPPSPDLLRRKASAGASTPMEDSSHQYTLQELYTSVTYMQCSSILQGLCCFVIYGLQTYLLNIASIFHKIKNR